MKKILLAMTGASGAPYLKKLLHDLLESKQSIYFIYSAAAQIVAKQELNWNLSANLIETKQFLAGVFPTQKLDNLSLVAQDDWFSPVASGSNPVDAMIICPASMGTVAAIANGLSDNLIERAADVCIKEKKQLIVVPREMPLSTIHLKNLLCLSELGVEIIPPSPGFYHNPTSIDELIDFVIQRILSHLNIKPLAAQRWGE